MKKLYTLMLLLATVGVSFTASAKSFTLVVDDASRVVVRNSLDGYNIVTFENNSYTFDGITEESYDFPIQCNSGYQIASANYEGTETSAAGAGTTFPTESFNLPVRSITDGATVVITTQEKQVPTITITTSDASVLAVDCNYETLQAVDGVFTAKVTNSWGSLNIRIAEDKQDEWALVKATADNGLEYTPSYGTISIYLGGITSDMALTVETINLTTSRTATMTVTVNGNPEDVILSRSSGSQVALTGEVTTVKFNPETETAFTVSPAVYGKTFYQVILDETPVPASGSNYNITAADGCNLVINTEWPELYAPVKFNFTNEGTENAVGSVRINNQNVTNWQDEDFKVRLGSSFNFSCNTNRFTISQITVNDQNLGTSTSWSTTVTDETPINITITAEKKPSFNITFTCEDYNNVMVYNGYGSDESERITLTGETTVFEIPQTGYNFIVVKAADGYRITTLVDDNGNDLNVGSSNYFSADTEVFAVVEEIARPKTFTVYVEPATWSYRCITLSSSDYTLSKVISGDDLPIGYSTVKFADFDLPINFSGYPSLYLYQNDAVATLNYGALDAIADGDVIKMFCNEPASYSVNYTISDEVNVVIEHDHATIIENPSTHTVLQGTEVVVSVAAEESPVAQVAARTAAPVLKVNDEIITPDSEGKYMFAVNADSNVSVEPGTPAGIDSIEAIEGGADAPVYNLQGIRVGNASDLRHLPAGLYISGGQKIRK